ncbi:roadblock/LC7 domain-containing protein [Streptomyces mangrovi]|uniref:roadblock/LC7 domain-containing protein n=1 Tax=Streptomyces mangrovi TaxID=1206892 RepID=UPI00399D3ED9
MPTTPAAFPLDGFDRSLQGLVERVPHTRGAVLLSSDGLAKSWFGLDEDAADRLAALASGLSGLADGAARLLQPNAAEELSLNVVVIDLGAVALLVCAGVEGSRLLVTADREADHGEVGYEMAKLAGSLHDQASAAPATALAADGEFEDTPETD